jgi:hypothetical protein
MINEDVAKEINSALDKDFPTAKGLGLKPMPSTGIIGNAAATVTSDIDALKRKLDTIVKGIHMLRDQL